MASTAERGWITWGKSRWNMTNSSHLGLISSAMAKSRMTLRLSPTWSGIFSVWNDFATFCVKKYFFPIIWLFRKDVLRTDRQHKFYAGDANENVTALYNILTTFALHHPTVGYCQVKRLFASFYSLEVHRQNWAIFGLKFQFLFSACELMNPLTYKCQAESCRNSNNGYTVLNDARKLCFIHVCFSNLKFQSVHIFPLKMLRIDAATL